MLAAVLAAAPACATLAADEAPEPAAPPTRDDILKAVADTRADLERPVSRPDSPHAPEPAPSSDSSSSSSFTPPDLSGIESALRVLFWGLGGLVVLFCLWNLRRWVKVRGTALPDPEPVLPGTVSGLDIRPASVPEDVAAQAARLWREGEGRAALALLYRAALSRLVHGHAVPIRAASTERECMTLSARVLPPPSADFLAGLIQAWQLAAYGASLPEAQRMQALCDDFERLLPRKSAAGAQP